MHSACTCAFRRALSASTESLIHVASRRSTSSIIRPITSLSTNANVSRRRAFSAVPARRYPRQATPFSLSNSRESDPLSENVEAGSSTNSEEASHPQASTSKAPSTSYSPWYLSETPSSSTNTSKSTSKPKPIIPTPPNALPSYLLPLWNHIYESPFLDQHTINFINSEAVQENVSIDNMDASVSNWVDWVVVASLRNGRERGIRGASEGVKTAMYDCLKIFDEQLAISEALSAASTPSTNSPPIKRKKKISPVLIEGLEIKEPQWALIDGGKAVIHIMTIKARKTWQVEGVASAFSDVNREREMIGEQEEEGEEGEFDEEIDFDENDAVVKSEVQASDRERESFQPKF